MKSENDNLRRKQYQLEKKFAERIKASSGPERVAEVAEAEEVITGLLRERRGVADGEDLCMGTGDQTIALIHRIIGTGKSVIDIGCGTGMLVRSLAASQRLVVGLDICRPLIQTAIDMRPHLTNTRFHSCSIEEAPFEPESFDIACSIAVLEHLHPADLRTHLSHIYSLLRPGGTFIIQTPNRLDGPHDVSRHFLPLGSPPEGLHLREYTKSELARLLSDVGFGQFCCTMWPARVYARLPFSPATRTGFKASVLFENMIERFCPVMLSPLAVHMLCNGLLVCRKPRS